MSKKKEFENLDFSVPLPIPRSSLKEETIQTVFAIIFFIIGTVSILAAYNKGGMVGDFMYQKLSYLFGSGYILVPIILFVLGFSFLKTLDKKFDIIKTVGGVIFFFSGLALIDIFTSGDSGLIGHWISYPLQYLFSDIASGFILFGFLLISVVIIFDTKISLESIMKLFKIFVKVFKRDKKEKNKEEKVETKNLFSLKGEEKNKEEKEIEPKIVGDIAQKDNKENKKKNIKDSEEDIISISKNSFIRQDFVLPPLSILEKDKGKPEVGDIKANANIIKRTLQNFNISVEMDEISIGPSVTRYALKPAEGVRIAKIASLSNDLSLALAAHPLRIEAPIPGKSLVGIEIPNSTKTMVGLGSILSADEYKNSEKALTVALGKGVSGKPYFANIHKMPHLLIAGATGSGKSVTMHVLINSLLFKTPPQNLKFIMIDPKRVELTLYNKIPHLLTPVITDPKKAILSLKWAVKEMERRYATLQEYSVQNIESYHKQIYTPYADKVKTKKIDIESQENSPESMPYIVIIIDELADIMQTFPRELETGIVRLAQMSRAVGIHLILSTQRPSVNVITGLIKANVPSRLALQVASGIDSRTILDATGAEKLLGQGDMLFQSGEMSKPVRLQSPYISETEIKKVVAFLVDNYKDEINNKIDIAISEKEKPDASMFNATLDSSLGEEQSLEDSEDDPLYAEAKAAVVEAGKASTSYIQRKLRIGYSRAAALMDALEEKGVIGPADGAKPREIIEGGAPDMTVEENSLVDSVNERLNADK